MPYPETSPRVGVIMGSDSDLETMSAALPHLDHFGIAHEFRVISAHRTPERMAEYGQTAVSRGLEVIIAGAGGSAHLPGMVASETRLPVLGVAIESGPDTLNTAVGSMVKMPEGIPLFFMGRGPAGAGNAGLGAVRILALANPELARAYDTYVTNLATSVEEKDDLLQRVGPVEYKRIKAEEAARKARQM